MTTRAQSVAPHAASRRSCRPPTHRGLARMQHDKKPSDSHQSAGQSPHQSVDHGSRERPSQDTQRHGAATQAQGAASERDPLVKAVRQRRARHAQWQREGDLSVGRRLAQIGVLGWIVITPTLAGLYTGRWLDERAGTALFWSAPLMMAGVCLGGWSAWKWMNAR